MKKVLCKKRKGCFIYDVENKGDVIWYIKLVKFYFFEFFNCFFFRFLFS